MIGTHAFFLSLLCLLAFGAWSTGYPNLGPLAGIYAVGSIILFEIATRRARAAPRRVFWRTGCLYAVLMGL